MAWNPLRSQSDLDDLTKLFGGFHDGCLREVHIWTGHSVNTNFSMSVPRGLGKSVRMLVQRQWDKPSAIELLFEQVLTFHLHQQENGDGIIYGADLFLLDETFYWADDAPWLPTDSDRDHCTWVAAKKLFWRDASEWMGSQLRYGSMEE